jgi:cytoskeletal protein CcmA (bactofilin family)
MTSSKAAEVARLGKTLAIRGELSGSEDVYIDGQLEGSIELQGNLMVGPSGQVHANVNAKSVILHGKLEGNIQASERTELKRSAVAVGDISTQRVAIEEGAYYKGKVDTHPGKSSELHTTASGTSSLRDEDGFSAASSKPHGSSK